MVSIVLHINELTRILCSLNSKANDLENYISAAFDEEYKEVPSTGISAYVVIIFIIEELDEFPISSGAIFEIL